MPTPRWFLYRGEEADIATLAAKLAYPVFAKPAFEGSSKGILTRSVLDTLDELHAALGQSYAAYRQPVLVEEFIEGDELTVGVVGNDPPEVLGIMRVLPTSHGAEPFVYSLEVKRDWQRRVRYACPAPLRPEEEQAVIGATLAAWQTLGCRDVARFDFRLRDGVPYFLEANPLPGLWPVSGDLVLLARTIGIEHRELVQRILAAASRRCRLCATVAAGQQA